MYACLNNVLIGGTFQQPDRRRVRLRAMPAAADRVRSRTLQLDPKAYAAALAAEAPALTLPQPDRLRALIAAGRDCGRSRNLTSTSKSSASRSLSSHSARSDADHLPQLLLQLRTLRNAGSGYGFVVLFVSQRQSLGDSAGRAGVANRDETKKPREVLGP